MQLTAVGCASSCLPVCFRHHILHGLPGCCPGPHFLVRVQPALASTAKATSSAGITQ